MKTNDIKSGTRVRLRSGWYDTAADNQRGNIRMAEVDGEWKSVELTDYQKKLLAQCW